MKILYVHNELDTELIAEIYTNHSVSIETALEIAGVDMEHYAEVNGWESYDPNALRLEA